MHIRICPSDGTHCTHCKTIIRRCTLRVSGTLNKKYVPYYHLQCFQPQQTTPLQPEDVDYGDIREEKDLETIKEWARAWNTQFEGIKQWELAPCMEKIQPSRCQEPLRTICLFIFEYLSLKDLEMNVSLVKKAWLLACRDSQYWQFLLNRDFQYRKSSSDYRKKYISYKRTTCWRCKQILHLEDIEYMCPLYKRPLCKCCSRAEDCRIVAISSLVEHKNVHPTTIRALDLPTFVYYGVESVYMRAVEEALVPYAEKRRKLIVDLMKKWGKSQIYIEKMQKMDLKAYYRPGFVPCCYGIHLMMVFCGKHREAQRLKDSINEFKRKIKVILNRLKVKKEEK